MSVLLKQLTDGFIRYMTPKPKPEGYRFKYGIEVTALSADRKWIFLTFTFRKGARYCCECSSCRHGLLFQSDYDRLWDCMREAGVEVRRPMTICMRCVYEEGALFAVDPGAARPEYQAVEKGWEREEVYKEADAVRESRGSNPG